MPGFNVLFIFLFYALVAEIVEGNNPSYCYRKSNKDNEYIIGWRCDNSTHKCVKTFTSNASSSCLYSLNVCKLTCDETGSLWPKPSKHVKIDHDLVSIQREKIIFTHDIPENSAPLKKMLESLQQYFIDTLSSSQVNNTGGHQLQIIMKLYDVNTLSYTYETSEKYYLFISTLENLNRVQVTIEADNYFGLRHGIETLTQLVVYDDFSKSFLIPIKANISDVPAYKHRGILLDTSRSYFSVNSIKRLLNGMAQNKLNTFHWHITDSHSFPFASKSYPQMTEIGAYSPSKIYTWSDIEEIVEYAKIRGIRVVPELDAPSHVGEGWQFFDLKATKNDSVLLCFKAEPWAEYCAEPPCGFLNPINDEVYDILGNIYTEYRQLFESDIFHMGGDEVTFNCWRNTSSIVEYLKKRGKNEFDIESYFELWSEFQNKALQRLDKVSKNKYNKIVLWTSTLTDSKNVTKYLNSQRYIIQIWSQIRNIYVKNLLLSGYDVIFSNYDALYFDCGFGPWTDRKNNNWCSPYIGWQKVYMNDPLSVINDFHLPVKVISQILGAEAALWSEESDENTLDSRIWPRGCALAERLWTNPKSDWTEAISRFLTQRERMQSRGISPDLAQPMWCYQNDGLCDIPSDSAELLKEKSIFEYGVS